VIREPVKPKPSLLDPLKPVINEWLQADLDMPRKQRHTAKRIYDRLKQEYPKQLQVKYRTVQYYVAGCKRKLYADAPKGYLPLAHPAGEAQVDFGEFVYDDRHGERKKAYHLAVSFPYSNAAYCQVFKGQNLECLLQGIQTIITHMSAIPHRLVFDNLSAAVSHVGKGHERKLTDGFQRFMTHYGIETVFCNPAAGWEKGNVENKVGYSRHNLLVPRPVIDDFKAFNAELLVRCDTDMNRPHYHKKVSIKSLFEADYHACHPLPSNAFDIGKLVIAKTDNYGKIQFESNRYSVSPLLTRQTVYLKITSDSVVIMDEDYTIIVTHERMYEKGQDVMNWLPYLSLMAKRPMALKYTTFYDQLPDNWKQHLTQLDGKGKQTAIQTLKTILTTHDMPIAEQALEQASNHQRCDADSILASYYRLTNPSKAPEPLTLSKNVMDMPVFIIEPKKYDDLLSSEVAQ
jgi:transposase